MKTGGNLSLPQEKGWQRPFLNFAQGVMNLLDWSGRLIVFCTMTGMFLFLSVNVLLRYSTGNGVAWAYEIHALLLPWLVAGGVVVAANRHRNIAITLLLDRLDGRALRLLYLAIQISIVIICVGVLWSSQPILRAAQYQSYATIDLKQIWGYLSLVFAFAGMALIAFLEAFKILMGENLIAGTLEKSSLS